MKKITIITLFLVAFIDIKAQVDPQVSYPIINGNIRDKYVWTHTGGIGRFTVDDIVRTARNGVNGQDSTGLGGNLTQNTEINTNSFNYNTVNYQGISGYQLTSLNTNGCTKNIAIATLDASFNYIMQTVSNIDTCTGNIRQFNGYAVNSTGEERLYSAGYNTTSGKGRLDITLKGTTTGAINDLATIDFGGNSDNVANSTVITIMREDGFNGDILDVKNNNVTKFLIKSDGNKDFKLPIYDNDSDAITNGLVVGDVYELSNTNTYGLPAGIHKTVK